MFDSDLIIKASPSGSLGETKQTFHVPRRYHSSSHLAKLSITIANSLVGLCRSHWRQLLGKFHISHKLGP